LHAFSFFARATPSGRGRISPTRSTIDQSYPSRRDTRAHGYSSSSPSARTRYHSIAGALATGVPVEQLCLPGGGNSIWRMMFNTRHWRGRSGESSNTHGPEDGSIGRLSRKTNSVTSSTGCDGPTEKPLARSGLGRKANCRWRRCASRCRNASPASSRPLATPVTARTGLSSVRWRT